MLSHVGDKELTIRTCWLLYYHERKKYQMFKIMFSTTDLEDK